MRVTTPFLAILLLASCMFAGCASQPDRYEPPERSDEVNLSPETWKDDYDAFMVAQLAPSTEHPIAVGERGAVTVAYGALALPIPHK